ncbi:hypothetical protein LOK49_LG11G00483 [Camellia lanceoleosa]|uniref:Uncharacterized protein n=1 Tax=Camellia lanceoleosa TaxID=1840588 RepID=A0ACC0FZW6_9ERIC|nr:hypothetical protein LOK49_LG11G00483 [Camellia lanceoleosa]
MRSAVVWRRWDLLRSAQICRGGGKRSRSRR